MNETKCPTIIPPCWCHGSKWYNIETGEYFDPPATCLCPHQRTAQAGKTVAVAVAIGGEGAGMTDHIRRDEAIIAGMAVALEGLNTPLKIRARFDEIPAADVVEVVRCKDCRDCMEFTPEYKEESGYYGTCRRLLFPMLDADDARIKADDYCSYGERKGE